MAEITITAQQIALLDLIGRGEAVKGSNPYTTLWPTTTEPSLPQMTLAEVSRFQLSRTKEGYGSNAVGRYQLVRKDLNQSVSDLGLSATEIRFTPRIQDVLMIDRLKKVRKLDEWLDGSLTSDKFMIRLAQEFSSIPVPYPLNGANRPVVKGESYYSTDSFNTTKHDPDTLFQELEDILDIVDGEERVVSTAVDGPNGVIPATGSSPKAQTAAAAAGVGVGSLTGGNAGARPLPASDLPKTSNVYDYRPLDPLDDRYDFRTGQTVKDVLIYGTGASGANPIINGNIGPAKVATTNSGAAAPGGTADITNENAINSALTGGKQQTAPGGPGATYDDASTEQAPIDDTASRDARLAEPTPLSRVQINQALPRGPLTGAR